MLVPSRLACLKRHRGGTRTVRTNRPASHHLVAVRLDARRSRRRARTRLGRILDPLAPARQDVLVRVRRVRARQDVQARARQDVQRPARRVRAPDAPVRPPRRRRRAADSRCSLARRSVNLRSSRVRRCVAPRWRPVRRRVKPGHAPPRLLRQTPRPSRCRESPPPRCSRDRHPAPASVRNPGRHQSRALNRQRGRSPAADRVAPGFDLSASTPGQS